MRSIVWPMLRFALAVALVLLAILAGCVLLVCVDNTTFRNLGPLSLVAAAGFAYFLPSVMAFGNRHPNRWAVMATNVLLGWTFLGWVLALIWSLTGQPARPSTRV